MAMLGLSASEPCIVGQLHKISDHVTLLTPASVTVGSKFMESLIHTWVYEVISDCIVSHSAYDVLNLVAEKSCV